MRQFDPTYLLPRDIKDGNGKVLFAKGTPINVYERMQMPGRMIVISDRDSHYRWLNEVAKPTERDKILIGGGNVLEARRRHRANFYQLDARGVERFGLERLPAIVEQDGVMLRVSEYVPTP